MRIYLAASYSRHKEMQGHAENLRRLGHNVTSTWIEGVNAKYDGLITSGTIDEKSEGFALADMSDLRSAEAMVFFSGQSMRGGRHVEFGVALERGMSIIVVGPRENVFHYLPEVVRVDDFDECLDVIGESY